MAITSLEVLALIQVSLIFSQNGKEDYLRSKTESQHCPDKLTTGDPYRGSHFGEDDLGWQLTDHISDSPSYIDQIELVASHVQVFFHS